MVTGSLQERNGIYHMALNLYVNGKRKVKWISTGLPVKGNKRRAEEMLTEAKLEYEQKQKAKREHKGVDILVSDYIKRWLQIVKPTIARSTFESYENMFNARIDKHFRDLGVTLDDLEPQHIEELYQKIYAEGYTTNTVIHYHAVIRKALQAALKQGMILRNPADMLDRPKKNQYISSYYTSEQVKTLFEASEEDPLHLVIILGSFYGLRRSEVLGLRWSAIDFEKKTLVINHKVTEAKVDGKFETFAEDKLKTASSYRTLPLIPQVEPLLLEAKERQKVFQRMLKKSYCKDYLDYVCVDQQGVLYRPNYVTEHFIWFLKKFNLPKIRFHDLRHSCASMLVAAGVPMKQIQEWMGHSDFNTTANIYSHLDFNSKLQSAKAIGELLGGTVPETESKIPSAETTAIT